MLLYDLTSTYAEGAAEENPMMRRGYSRDHRPDCQQLMLALVVNQDGFPFSYELFDGNRADVTTVEAILRTVERKHGKARRVWIFDRGVVSEENLVAIRKRGEEYLVGTTRSKLKQFEAELLKDDFGKIRPDVEVKQIKIPDAGRWAGPATDSSWPERPPPLALARCVGAPRSPMPLSPSRSVIST